jgi:UDP-glucose 4-epimerase
MKRIILTGGTGFVGANLARRLLHEGHHVHLLVRSGYSTWRIEEIQSEIQLHIADFRAPETLLRVLELIQPDWIFHLAAHGAYSWQTDAAQIVQTNILGTINLLESALKVGFESFVNTGSSSEYGLKAHAPSEDEGIDPNSYYAVGKASATLYCRFSAAYHQVNIPTLRLYSVYGPYEEPNRLIPALIKNGLNGEFPPLVNPNIARDFIHTEDVNEAFIKAASVHTSACGAIYNVGSGVQTTLREAVETARKVMNIEAQPQWGTMPNRGWDTDVWVADSRKIQHELGWTPRYSFEDGLRQTVAWFQDNLSYYQS